RQVMGLSLRITAHGDGGNIREPWRTVGRSSGAPGRQLPIRFQSKAMREAAADGDYIIQSKRNVSSRSASPGNNRPVIARGDTLVHPRSKRRDLGKAGRN